MFPSAPNCHAVLFSELEGRRVAAPPDEGVRPTTHGRIGSFELCEVWLPLMSGVPPESAMLIDSVVEELGQSSFLEGFPRPPSDRRTCTRDAWSFRHLQLGEVLCLPQRGLEKISPARQKQSGSARLAQASSSAILGNSAQGLKSKSGGGSLRFGGSLVWAKCRS